MSAPIRPLSRWQRPVFLLNSRQGHFSAAISRWRRLSRSYAANLPSSLTKVLSYALVYSTSPPVSVCGTGMSGSSLRGFSWPPLQSLYGSPSCSRVLTDGFSCLPPTCTWNRHSTRRLTLTDASPLRSPAMAQDCLPVVHRLRLSPSAKARLTRRGLTFRRKPRGFGACGSHTC